MIKILCVEFFQIKRLSKKVIILGAVVDKLNISPI